MTLRLMSLVGLISFIFIAWLLSTNRKAIKWKTVIVGCVLQLIFALFILKTPIGITIFDKARDFFTAILNFSKEGAQFVFGPLADIGLLQNVMGSGNAFIFAVQISATIIFVSSLMSIAYHLGIMQRIVYAFAVIMQKFMGTSGSESLAAAANVFLGQTEAPLVIRPYLLRMTPSEIMCMMTGGMASVAGGVLAAYVGFGIDAGHLLAASVMSAPATLAIAKLMVPETEISETAGKVELHTKTQSTNVLDAACHGAAEGMNLSINVMAMLIAFIALIALVNASLGWVGGFFTDTPPTLESLLGVLFSPLALLMGVPAQDMFQVGSLLGIKTVVNEFVGFIQLSNLKSSLDPRSYTIATYAMCGFANFASVAIQIGGIGALVPDRRKDLAKFGIRAMIGGTLASFMTAAIAGILL